MSRREGAQHRHRTTNAARRQQLNRLDQRPRAGAIRKVFDVAGWERMHQEAEERTGLLPRGDTRATRMDD